MIFEVILPLIALYVIIFIVLAYRGKVKGWPDEFGFLYSTNVGADSVLRIIFFPLYQIGHQLGMQKLNQPFYALTV